MKVVQLSTMDIQGGGGSRAAYRLHCALQKQGVDSQMIVKFKQSTNPTVHGKTIHSTLQRKFSNLALFVDEIPSWFTQRPNKPYYSTAWWPDHVQRRLNQLQPELVNLHWVNGGFIRLESIARWPWPLVWTLHDMWPFDGAEHYPQAERYIDGYTSANRPAEESGFDVSRWVWERKHKAWSTLKHLTLVSPSQWLADCAKRSALFKNYPVSVIPNGVDINQFQPREVAAVRQQLGLPLDKKIILFAANTIEDKRKGFDLLIEALMKLRQQTKIENIGLAVVGNSHNATLHNIGLPIYALGYINDESRLVDAYSAADILVLPSRQDNLPNIILEAMACGTPCVAFKIGGLPDMITHQQTGYLAQPEDSTDLAKGIQWTLDDAKRLRSLGDQACQRIEQHFSDTLQAQRYSALYQKILSPTK